MSKLLIVKAATKLAVVHGYTNLTRQQIAEHLDIFPSSVSFHCGTMAQLRDQIVEYAIDNGYTVVLGQALAARHPLAAKAPKEMRTRAARLLAA